MSTTAHLQAGARVQTPDGPGYFYALDGDYAAVVLDKYAGRTNAPIYWARLVEVTLEDAPALGELQGLTGAALKARLPRLPHDTAYLLSSVLQAGQNRWGAALLDRHGYTLQAGTTEGGAPIA